MKRSKKKAKEPKIIDARKIWDHADKFALADHWLRQKTNPYVNYTATPSLTLSAFTVELLLKTILSIEGKPLPDSHRLHVLFRQIEGKNKQRIIKLWDAGPRQRIAPLALREGWPLDLPRALISCGEAFVALRYQYEDADRVLYYLAELPRLLAKVILELRPDWIEPHSIQPTSPSLLQPEQDAPLLKKMEGENR